MWKHNTPGVQDFQRHCAVGNCSIFLKEEADTTQAGLALLPHLEEEGRSISFEYFPFPVAKAETTTTLLRLKCENWIMPKPSRETRRKYSRLLWVREQDKSRMSLYRREIILLIRYLLFRVPWLAGNNSIS